MAKKKPLSESAKEKLRLKEVQKQLDADAAEKHRVFLIVNNKK